MLHAYLPLAKSTFGEPSFPIKTRLVLADSLLFTRLTFAFGVMGSLAVGFEAFDGSCTDASLQNDSW